MKYIENPKLRNELHEITFIAKNGLTVNEGDVILGECKNQKFSAYTITKITKQRDAAMTKHQHYTAHTSWGLISILEVSQHDNKELKKITDDRIKHTLSIINPPQLSKA